jgi:hypothetical protein
MVPGGRKAPDGGAALHAQGEMTRMGCSVPGIRTSRSRFFKSEALTGYGLISPAVFLMLVLLAYPFVLAVSISLSDRVL